MIGNLDFRRQVMSIWRFAWPCWTLILFMILPAVRMLPDLYARAIVVAPVLLMIPGSLTLGAIFGARHRPQGAFFICCVALLGVAWSVFASLNLYVLGVLITAKSTYWCLLVVSFTLASIAEARILLERPGSGRRATRRSESAYRDLMMPRLTRPKNSRQRERATTPRSQL